MVGLGGAGGGGGKNLSLGIVMASHRLRILVLCFLPHPLLKKIREFPVSTVLMLIILNYAPNFEKVEGAYCFGLVRPSVRLSFCSKI